MIGEKAKNLFKLKKLGYNVPPFFCVKNTNNIKKILQNAKQISNNSFSVRSSSVLEDSYDKSYAGMFTTFLDVKLDELENKINDCINNYDTNKINVYRQKNIINLKKEDFTVIVQKMILSDFSGVIFTANPMGILNEIVITVGLGTGDNVVDNKTETTTYYYNLIDNNYYFESNNKSPVLSQKILKNIIKTTQKLKKDFGEYIDIEFAIKDEELYILQVRYMTSIRSDKIYIFDNSNIVESYPNITLPLSATFAISAYSGLFNNIASICFKNDNLLKKYSCYLNNMVDVVNGTMYYQINNWYNVIKFLPFSNYIIPIWQEMLGVSNKTFNKDLPDLNLVAKTKISLNIFYEILNINTNMKKLDEDFKNINKYFYSNFNTKLNNDQLLNLYTKIEKRVLKNWGITLINDLYSFIFTSLTKKYMLRFSDDANKYISNIKQLESLKPVKSLIKLSMYCYDNNMLDELSNLKNNKDVINYLKTCDKNFSNKFKLYIKKYGDRNLEELKLETKTFRTSPILLIKQIIIYCNNYHKLKSMMIEFDKKREETKKDFVLKILSKNALVGISNREISRLNRTRIYGMMRQIFICIGKNLYKNNELENPTDVFYLSLEQIFEHTKFNKLNLEQIVLDNKTNYYVYDKLPPFSRIEFFEKPFNKVHKNINSNYFPNLSNKIIGTPCSTGYVIGEVIVINDPKEQLNCKDKILVTKNTDPGWVFLMAQSKGIISEMGSLLSHTAIISRELKIPSIVGVKNATNIFKTGDIVKMNCKTGEITYV